MGWPLTLKLSGRVEQTIRRVVKQEKPCKIRAFETSWDSAGLSFGDGGIRTMVLSIIIKDFYARSLKNIPPKQFSSSV